MLFSNSSDGSLADLSPVLRILESPTSEQMDETLGVCPTFEQIEESLDVPVARLLTQTDESVSVYKDLFVQEGIPMEEIVQKFLSPQESLQTSNLNFIMNDIWHMRLEKHKNNKKMMVNKVFRINQTTVPILAIRKTFRLDFQPCNQSEMIEIKGMNLKVEAEARGCVCVFMYYFLFLHPTRTAGGIQVKPGVNAGSVGKWVLRHGFGL